MSKRLDYFEYGDNGNYVLDLECELKEYKEENKQLIEQLEQTQKELNEENLQCSQYAVEIHNLVEQLSKEREMRQKAINKLKIVKEFNFDKVGRYELLEILETENGEDI